MIKTQLTLRLTPGTPGVIADIQLPITLDRSAALLGKGEETNRYIAEETAAAIPRIKDQELIRFRLAPEPDEARSITPFFLNSGGTSTNSYESAGYSSVQTISLTQGLARSMYVFELYDSQDTDKQVLLSRAFTKGDDPSTYLPVLNSGGTVTTNLPFLQMVTAGGTPTTISPLALPVYFVDNQPSGTIYLQISFFNSVTGKRVKMRRRLTGLSIADNRYIPLTYNTATRTYHLPVGSAIEIEEVRTPVTSAEAAIERQKRLANMIAVPAFGKFNPLG